MTDRKPSMGMSRDSENSPPHTDGAQLLFGGELNYDAGFSRHEFTASNLKFIEMIRRTPSMLAIALRLAWSADRRALIAVAAAELAQGVARAVGLIYINHVFVELFSAGPTVDRLKGALPFLAIVCLAASIGVLLASVSTAATGRLEPKVERFAAVQVLRQAARVELRDIEDPEFHRLLDSAQYGTDAARSSIGSIVAASNASLTFISAAGVLAILHPSLLPLLLLVAAPKGWGAVQTARRTYTSTQSWLQHLRARRVVAGLLTEQQAAAEIRVHGTGDFLLEQYEAMASDAEDEQTRLARSNAGTQLQASVYSGVASLITYATLGLLLAHNVMPLAVAGTAVLAIRTGTSNLSIVVLQLNKLYEDGLYLNDLSRLCQEAEQRYITAKGSLPVPSDPKAIRMEAVTYTYQGSEKPVLRNVNLTVNRGEVIALVGENGSGKTTLTKLLCGLYTPDSGRVTWDGIDTVALDRTQLFKHVALVSQDFKRFPFTARINVLIGRPSHSGDVDLLERAASYSGADKIISTLQNGWNTLLARHFAGGAELSGGQWQRLGLARARFRNAPLMVCDEPTSALDPKAEIETFNKIRGLADEGHTVLLITHRLASVREADRIYVLRDGEIIEEGNHEELMDNAGYFSTLYNLQAQQYSDRRGGAEMQECAT
ncbi:MULTISPECIES: ABC transporter ATP-binding protein [Streptomyces]|nr:ABC transporter ATP-binding protein [Streptomyces virginiae]